MDKIKDSGSLAQGSIPCGFTKTKPQPIGRGFVISLIFNIYLTTAIFFVLILPFVLTFTK